MSQFADELLARLAVARLPSRHDPLTGDADRRLAEVRSGYLEQLSAHPLGWHDLTPFEQRFMMEIVQGFEAWRRSRAQPKPN